MKIALVSPYDFSYPGGVANHITNLDRCLCSMGHVVKVIAPASSPVTTFGERFIQIGKPRPIPNSGSVARITLSLTLAGRIKSVLEEEKFDIVHLHEPFAPMLCSAVLRFSNTINIGTFHACDARPGYHLAWPIGIIMLRRRRRKLQGRIAVSPPAKRFASKYIPGEFEIIPNGVDLKVFNPDVPPLEEFQDGKINILFIGRLEKRKGVGYLLNAFRRLKKEMPNTRLIIAGPGTRLRGKYEHWVKEWKVDDVVFAGMVSYHDLPRYYRTADIFCAPAITQESFGIVLLEAMAMGKPIVATNIEGYASVVSHGQEAWLVPPKDSRQLSDALAMLIRDEKLRNEMAAKGIMKAQEYSWERVAERVVDYYNKILNEFSDSDPAKALK
ncbi:MAG: glycosyltransferase family 4 protein [Dehalococcoidales bacterium]|nr:glycosyltransferase family 4 protein [Dehalococcoidales bacterium]